MEFQELQVRDELIAVDFQKMPWTPVRAFTVTASQDEQERGNHITGSNEYVILVNGSVSFEVTLSDGTKNEVQLNSSGESFYMDSTSFVKYRLLEKGSTILVFSDRSYEARK